MSDTEEIDKKKEVVSGIIEHYKNFQNKKDPNKYDQIKRAYNEELIPMINASTGKKGGDPKKNININRSRPRPREEYYNYAKFNQPVMPDQMYGPQPMMPGQMYGPQPFIPGQMYGPQPMIPGQIYGPQPIIPGQPYGRQTYSQPMYNQGQIHSPYGQQNLDYYNHNFQY